MGKSWASKGADFEKLKGLLQNNEKVFQEPPRIVYTKYGFDKLGYDLTSFRNGLNQLKKELGIPNGQQPMSSEAASFLSLEDGK